MNNPVLGAGDKFLYSYDTPRPTILVHRIFLIIQFLRTFLLLFNVS